MTNPKTRPHPAKYTAALLPVMAEMLAGANSILDPFAGTGRIFQLADHGIDAIIQAIELEPEWANCHPDTKQGDALDLPYPNNTFDAICTSPAYGNRMADTYTDGTPRNTYTHKLGRPLSQNNAGQFQWGGRYRTFHQRAWAEALRVLKPKGKFVLNIKDHIRAGQRQHVTAWHIATIEEFGLQAIDHKHIKCPGNRYGQNAHLRIDTESLILFQ